MGFLDSFGKAAGNAAKKGLEKVNETGQEAMEKYERFDRLSDEQLKAKYRSGNYTDKMAASKLLKERGYGSQD